MKVSLKNFHFLFTLLIILLTINNYYGQSYCRIGGESLKSSYCFPTICLRYPKPNASSAGYVIDEYGNKLLTTCNINTYCYCRKPQYLGHTCNCIDFLSSCDILSGSTHFFGCPTGYRCHNFPDGSSACVVENHNCDEPDGGINKYVNSTVTVRNPTTSTNTDSCINQNTLREYYCDFYKDSEETDRIRWGITLKSADLTCNFGCKHGKCIFCKDNDDGENLTVASSVKLDNGTEYFDTCTPGNQYSVDEYVCVNDNVQKVTKNCPKGHICQSGRCILDQSNLCVDPDRNDQFPQYRKTTVTNTTRSFTDVCYNASHVNEGICSNNLVSSEILSCGAGRVCINGECLQNQCVDSDNGWSYSIYGEVYDGSILRKDYCFNITHLYEYTCSGSSIINQLYNCLGEGKICLGGKCENFNCYDSDINSNPLFTRGYTFNLSLFAEDQCYNLTHVNEGRCIGTSSIIDTSPLLCPYNYFCSNGMCVPSTSCVDSDENYGNNDIFYFGQAGKGSVILSDYCVVEGGKVLKEAMCSNDNPVYNEYTCPLDYICHNGRCVSLQNQCIDFDNGLNKLVNGSASNSTHTIFDTCVDINRVNESYCPSSGTIIQTQVLTCDSNQVCLNGKCVVGEPCKRIEQDKKTTNGTVTLQDYCIDSNNLNYSYCGNNNEVLTRRITCQQGYRCDQQKKECVPINYCTDSDADEEDQLLKQGTTTNGTNTFSDTCDPNDQRKVIEYYCMNSEDYPDDFRIGFFSMLCPNNYVCDKGACISPSCSDSDGENVNILGIANNITNTLEDKCVPSDPTKVDEAVCDNSFVKYKRLSCDQGYLCDNGNCVPSPGDMCIENDNGKDAFSYGNVYAISASGTTDTFSDVCIDSIKVKEYYCESPNKLKVKHEIITCPDDYRCFFGACKQITCSDSDAGIVIEDKGITGLMVEGNYLTNPSPVEDFCTNNILTEYYCQNKDVKSSTIDCVSYNLFCYNGMCIDCFDSDGDNPYADGYAKNATSTLSDKCEIITDSNGNQRAKVTEYVCDGKLIKSKIYLGNVGSFCSLNNLGNPSFMINPTNCIEFFDTEGRKIVRFQNIEYRAHCAPNEIAYISYQCLSQVGPVKEIQTPCPVGTKCPYTLDYSYFTCNPISKTCSDSDNGNFYGIPGQVKISENGLITYYRDQCTNDGTNRLLEATCDGGNIRYILHECRDTCKVDINGRAYCLNVIQSDIPQTFNQIIPNVPNSFTVCFPLILLTVFFSLVVTYMLSKALGMTQLEQIVKNEFVELGNSFIQFVILLSIFGISSNFILPDNSSFVNTAVLIIDNINYHFAIYFNLVINNYANMVKLFTFSYDYSNMRYGFVSSWNSLTPLSGLMPLAEAILNLAFQLQILMAFNSVLKFLIVVMQAFGLFLLAFAFILKIIPFTRSIGTTLMALFISIQLFLPLGIYFMNFLMTDYAGFTTGGIIDTLNPKVPEIGNPPAYSAVCSQGMQVFTFIGEVNWANIICPPLIFIPYPVCKFIVTMFFVLVQHGFTSMMSNALINYISQASQGDFKELYLEKLRILSDVVIYSYVVSFISYMIILFMIISATRSISIALSGDIVLYGISRII